MADDAPIVEKQRDKGLLNAVGLMAGGTAISQLVTLAASPLLTRLYLPVDLGRFGLYLAFVSVAAVVVSLRYEFAVVSAKDSADASKLVILSLGLSLVGSVLSGFVLAGLILGSVLGFGPLPLYSAGVVVPSLILTSAFLTLRQLSIRRDEYNFISKALIAQASARGVAQVSLGFLRLEWLGLLFGDVLGRAIGVGRLLKQNANELRKHLTTSTFQSLWRLARRFSEFPSYSVPSSFIDTLAVMLPLPLISLQFGAAEAGQFALVQRVVSLPMVLLGSSVADAYFGFAAKLSRDNPRQSQGLLFKTAAALFLVGLAPAIGLIAFGESAFSTVFGADWRTAGQLAAALTPWMLSALVVSPISRLVYVYRRQRLKLIYDSLSLVSVLLVFYVGAARDLTLLDTLRALSWLQTVAYGVYFVLLVRIVSGSGTTDRKP